MERQTDGLWDDIEKDSIEASGAEGKDNWKNLCTLHQTELNFDLAMTEKNFMQVNIIHEHTF